MAGHDTSVRKMAPLMKPWLMLSPSVTKRCVGVVPAGGVTAMPRVGSVSGCRGSVWISTSAGTSDTQSSTMAHPSWTAHSVDFTGCRARYVNTMSRVGP